MIECAVKYGEDDKWIAVSFFAFLIKSDNQLQTREVDFVKKRCSEIFGPEELDYFRELVSREFDPADFDAISLPENKIIAKHILKEAIGLCYADGDYSQDEKDIIRKWGIKNGFDQTFLEDLETYVMLMFKLEKVREVLLNDQLSSAEAHNLLQELPSLENDSGF